jgi:hypothetical protein
MKFNTLLENNTNLFSVYKLNKFRCGDILDGGYTIGNIEVNYDCFISAGISYNDNFSIDFLKIYNLNIYDCYGFDGTIEIFPSNLTNIMTFVKKNIGYNNSEQITNLHELTEKYNNIFLKMDIEGGEWPWLLSMDNEKLNKISQIVIEFHGLTNTSWHNNMTINSFCSYDEKIVCLKKLEETHYLIHAHGNNADHVADNGMPNVIELTYVNKKFFNETPELNTEPLPIIGLDFPNEKRMPDVNLNFFPFVSMDIQKLKNENPFLIDIQDKQEYSTEDYINIQKQLNSKNITTILETLYDPHCNGFYDFNDFKKRVSRGITQKIIDIDSNLLPTKQLYKIGNGGNNRNCFVCCTPLSHDTNDDSRFYSSQKILKSLEDVGFNGHFYLFNGGFPNPTGTEMKYAGVPYCFKIFMMLEAEKLGFDKVIWIDSGCYALNNPEDLFTILYNNDVVFKTIDKNNYNAMVLKKTNEILNQFTSTTLVSSSLYVETIVFGFNLSSINIKNIIKEYYEMVKIGWSFFSIFPEEIVLSALFNKPEYKGLINSSTQNNKLQIHEKNMSEDIAKNSGFYFHHKDYSKLKPKNYITFDNDIGGRFGNQLFRYLTSKLFTIKFNHTYVSKNDFSCDDFIIVNDDNIYDFLENKGNISNNNIILRGYFQKSDLFVNYKTELTEKIFNTNNNDYWQVDNNTLYLKDYIINSKHNINLNPEDIVVSLRLDDFIQLPCKTSDIIPPQYYIEILNSLKIKNQKVYIVCDKIKYDWEIKYIEYFKNWNPILIQSTLINDIALMRDCKILLHSNSSLCWIISFLSDKNTRIIPCLPKIYMNQNQKLNKINENDTLKYITALEHDEVYNLNVNEDSVFPLSFCIPDECVVYTIPEKKKLLASLIPGDLSTYKFDKYKEKEYNEMYRESRFAITKMKGGWDCLRHYEILMNGCIPLFENLKECPNYTLTTYPKELNNKAYELFNNWIENEDCIEKYNTLCLQMLEHTRNFCTTSSTAKYFLNNIKNGNKIKNILLITCHNGINYNRETLWIGLKRYIKSINGVAVEHDKMPFLYNDFDNFSNHKYYTNNCFTFPKRIEKDKDYDMTETEIIEKINNNFWDLIIYGKVGPDEFCTFPLFDIVKTKYNKNKIAFIFGGDEIFNLKNTDKNSYYINMFNVPIYYYPYAEYLNYYKHFGSCFVRELDK